MSTLVATRATAVPIGDEYGGGKRFLEKGMRVYSEELAAGYDYSAVLVEASPFDAAMSDAAAKAALKDRRRGHLGSDDGWDIIIPRGRPAGLVIQSNDLKSGGEGVTGEPPVRPSPF